MKVRILIGNPNSGEWEEGGDISPIPYPILFAEKYPDLPPISGTGFEDQYSVEDHVVLLHGANSVTVNVHYVEKKNSISIIVKHNERTIVQVLGQAADSGGNGLSVLFAVPGEDYPVEPRCESG